MHQVLKVNRPPRGRTAHNASDAEASNGTSPFPRQMVISGNPAIGRVVFYRQIHLTALCQGQPYSTVPVGRTQEAIVRDISRRGLTQLFDEASGETTLPTDPSRNERIERAKFLKHFPDGKLPDVLTSAQLSCVAEIGAARICANLNAQLTIHGTSTALFDKLEAGIQDAVNTNGDYWAPAPVRDYYKMYLREREAAQQILKFFSTGHAGEEVGLIYGANHGFTSAVFSPRRLPNELLPEVTALGPADNGPWQAAKLITAARTERAQLALIERAEMIDCAVVPALLSDKVMQQAFSKIVIDPTWMDSAEERRDIFLSNIRSSKFLTEALFAPLVEEAYRSQTGPFRFLFPDKSLATRNLSSSPPYEISGLISEFPDAASQLYIVSQAKRVPVYAFDCIRNSAAQLFAIEKLTFRPGVYDASSREELAKFLIRKSRFKEVKTAVTNHFANGTGPFAARKWAACVCRSANAELRQLVDNQAEDLDAHLEAVQESTGVPTFAVWGIKGFRAKLLALEKLSREPDDERTAGEIKDALLSDMCNGADLSPAQASELRQKIELMAERREGVFEAI